MKFFKSEDFDDKDYTVGLNLFQKGQAAMWANAKLEREGKMVYSFEGCSIWYPLPKKYEDVPTHRALLIAIEPISEPKLYPDWESLQRNCRTLEDLANAVKSHATASPPCTHPSELVQLCTNLDKYKIKHDYYKCSQCNQRVQPTAFEVADE